MLWRFMVIRTEVKMDKVEMEILHGVVCTTFVRVGQIGVGTFGALMNEVCTALLREGRSAMV